MEHSGGNAENLVLVGEAINSIGTYNRDVQRSITSQVKELQSIVSLFTRSMLNVSKSSAASSDKLHQIEKQIEKCTQAEDLRVIKAHLEESLVAICEEAAHQEKSSDEIGNQVRETLSRPEAAAAVAEVVADVDLVTGLANFRAAQEAIRVAIAAKTSTYAVLLSVDRVESINSRFGFAVGDRILMLFSQHLAQRLSQNDQLFRWRGPAFMALFERTAPEMSVRAEVARMVAPRLEQQIEIGERSVLLPISASWMLTRVAGSTAESVTQKLDSFSGTR
jgi:diguanylate cyclase (GGDEF)-like protein